MSPDWEAKEDLRSARYRLRSLTRVRLGACVAFMAVFYLLTRSVGSALPAPVPWLAALYALAALVFRGAALRQRSMSGLERVHMLNCMFDLLIMWAICALVGPFRPPSVLLFQFVVLYGCLILPQGYALSLALLAAACYCSMLQLAAHSVASAPSPDWQVRYCFTATGSFVVTAVTLSFFTELLQHKGRQVQKANRRLHAAAERLRRHRDELERSVELRTADLQDAYRRLKVANRQLRHSDQLKTVFLANVSHELRTPLTSIRSFSEILRAYPDHDEASQREFLDIIVVECDRLQRLIDDLLDLTRIESGHMAWHFQPVDLARTVRSCTRALEPLAANQGLALQVCIGADLPAVVADEDRLAQVLTNLLGNALKFTADGAITVTAESLAGMVRVAVADTGCGVPEADRERLFEKFYQVSRGLTDKPKGTGLGLAICREIVAHHGGRIWVEGNEPQGTRVVFELPVAGPDSAVPLPHLSPDEAGALLVGGEPGRAEE